MNYVGLDLSLTATGVCIIGEDNTQFFTIKTKPHEYTPEERLLYIRGEIYRYVPEDSETAIEDYAFCANGQLAYKAELHGVIKTSLHSAGFSFRQYAPTALKKFASGKGNAGKDIILKCVYQHWGHDLSDNNQADACVLAHMVRCACGEGKYTAYQYEAVRPKKGK